MNRFGIRKLIFIVIIINVALLLVALVTIPAAPQDYSTVLFSAEGQLLNARIAKDEQWRFRQKEKLPANYIKAVTAFEDQYFFSHPGINPISLVRALVQNTKRGKIVSGGSTITMQDIRLRRGLRKRTLWNKSIEMYWALALEILKSKNAILQDYASRAPFGSNVVGIEAACWRYFDKPLSRLSWAEAACLAILPNSPALVHPGNNRALLEKKRNALLKKLVRLHYIDSVTCQLSYLEPVPESPRPLINLAPHALDYLSKTQQTESYFKSTINIGIQKLINESAYWGYENLSKHQIQNVAILVSETRSGEVLAYCGNAPQTTLSPFVDHIQAPRSTGSILKPLLYAGALNQGTVLPSSLADDIPVVIDGFQPQNFSRHYTGMIPLDQALIQSLNIPFVHLLKTYGLEHFHLDLQRLGLRHINKAPSHYGLTLVLGGAESCLWDLVGAYAYLGRTLMNYHQYDRRYFDSDNHPLRLLSGDYAMSKDLREPPLYHAASIYLTLNNLKKLNRPDESGQWNSFSSTQEIAWKTGTSFGFRDAWAIGVNPAYTVGIWVGNADGEGKPGLLGIKAAAPLLFEVFSKLPRFETNWFEMPYDELIHLPVCSKSGMKPSLICPELDTIWSPRFQDQTSICPFHQTVWLNNKTQLRVNRSCIAPEDLIEKTIFVVPPVQSYYYAINHPEFEYNPAWDPSCLISGETQEMKMIYPQDQSTILIPKDRDGKPGKIVFKLAHRHPEEIVYWHLDEKYIGNTQQFHEISLNTEAGHHTLSLTDSKGNALRYQFEVLAR